MKKDGTLRKMIDDPDLKELPKLKDKLLLLLLGAFADCGSKLERLEGLTWPEGDGVLFSSERSKIERSFSSATAEQIPDSPWWVEVGHDQEHMRRLLRMILQKLDYPPGLQNEAVNLLRKETPAEQWQRFLGPIRREP
jgi:hypothetical protein